MAADDAIGKAETTWSTLYEHYQRHAQCDDGSVYEGYSQGVVRLLATSWGEFPRVAEIAGRDETFWRFVIKHVDDLAGEENLEQVRKNAAASCPPNLDERCGEIADAAKRALGKTRQKNEATPGRK